MGACCCVEREKTTAEFVRDQRAGDMSRTRRRWVCAAEDGDCGGGGAGPPPVDPHAHAIAIALGGRHQSNPAANVRDNRAVIRAFDDARQAPELILRGVAPPAQAAAAAAVGAQQRPLAFASALTAEGGRVAVAA